MKKFMVCCLFFLSGVLLATVSAGVDRGALNGWTVRKTWHFSCQPISFSQSLDKKWVFVLGDDSTVHIYSIDGEEKGSIPVANGTLALDIEPRGKRLYLLNENKKYTAINISFSADSLEWSIQKSWKTTTRPLSFVHSKNKELVFVLEEDNAVHIYSFSGHPLGSIPVSSSTVAIDIMPRKSLLYLVDEKNTYTALKLFF
ncbi:MAG: hypothetical protein D3923_12540 [Candidatus Electrothrix sp. AR3]|nr:hypothetical protein [Candidatus Electrothrix sp. AR3]